MADVTAIDTLPTLQWCHDSSAELALELIVPGIATLVLGRVAVRYSARDMTAEYLALRVGADCCSRKSFADLRDARLHVLTGVASWLGTLSSLVDAKIRATKDPASVPLPMV